MAKILAISSGGGHWEQLMILKGAFDEFDVVYSTTVPGLAEHSGISHTITVRDCNRRRPLDTLRCVLDVYLLVKRNRPDLVLTTGAAPGLIALTMGKIFGASTIWIDSVANSEKLSMSGKLARHIADLHLSQWEHIADASGETTKYIGSVL